MQSSYKVIKNFSVVKDGAKKIVTEFQKNEETYHKGFGETNAKLFIDSYENLAKSMIDNARRQSEKILSTAYIESERVTEEAYRNAFNKGYSEGNQKGYDDGFKKAYEEGYEKNINRALQEAKAIKNNADNILRTCTEQKENYLKEKEEEIKNLIINCVENILKREIKDEAGMNGIIFEALSQVKNTKTFIIKSKGVYCKEFKKQIDTWKEILPFKGDIFIVADESIDEGNAIIERDNGKMVVGVDIALEKVKELLCLA